MIGALSERLSEASFGKQFRLGWYLVWRLSGVLSWLDYWLGLPTLCKVRHQRSVARELWNEDAQAVEQGWLECPRCGGWMGHLPA